MRIGCSTDGLLCLRSTTTTSFWHARCLRGPSTPTTVILLANSAFAQCSHQIRPEFGWIGGFRGRIAHFCLPWSAQRRIRQQYQQSCHQPPNWKCPRNGGFCGRKMGDYVVDKRVLAQGTQDVGLQLIPSPVGTVSRGRAVRRILAVRSYSPALPDV